MKRAGEKKLSKVVSTKLTDRIMSFAKGWRESIILREILSEHRLFQN